jgi:hypothetical protein
VRLNDDPRVLAVCALLQRSCDGDEPTPEEWAAAGTAASDAAGTAAGAAARAAARVATGDAARAAAWTATGGAARAAAWDAAWDAARAAQRDELLSLLRACQPDAAAVSALPDDLTFRAYYDRVCLEAGAASLLET